MSGRKEENVATWPWQLEQFCAAARKADYVLFVYVRCQLCAAARKTDNVFLCLSVASSALRQQRQTMFFLCVCPGRGIGKAHTTHAHTQLTRASWRIVHAGGLLPRRIGRCV
eukprot:366438-Chlamydomonas_euryale.AAC.17